MTTEEFKKILDKGETDTVEFKSWIKARNPKEIIALAVDELIAFANHKGGTVYFGVEDKLSDGTLWEGQIALYFRWTCLPDCAVPELDADYRRNDRRLS